MVMYLLRCCKDTAFFCDKQIFLYVIQHNNRLHKKKNDKNMLYNIVFRAKNPYFRTTL